MAVLSVVTKAEAKELYFESLEQITVVRFDGILANEANIVCGTTKIHGPSIAHREEGREGERILSTVRFLVQA